MTLSGSSEATTTSYKPYFIQFSIKNLIFTDFCAVATIFLPIFLKTSFFEVSEALRVSSGSFLPFGALVTSSGSSEATASSYKPYNAFSVRLDYGHCS